MNSINTTEGENVFKSLQVPSRIAIVPHHNPDGDALGAALGLYHITMAMGHNVNIVCPNDFPDFLKWMPGAEKLIIYYDHKKTASRILNEAALVVYVDFNCPDRISPMDKAIINLPGKSLLIDHHPDPKNFTDFCFSDTSVSSTSELIINLSVKLGYSSFINKKAAECLFTGIMTDTGSFSHNCSRPETWRTIARLLEYGIDKDKISSLVFDNFSEYRMKLLGFSLNEKMVILSKFHTGFISLSRDEMLRYNYHDGDTEGFVNYPLSVNGVMFSALFLEKKDHVKISFRSRGNFAVNSFASMYFAGGGHLNAAGGRSELNLEETILKFVSLLSTNSPIS